MKALAVLSVLALASCATAFDEKLQPVEFGVSPAGSAKCSFVGRDFTTEATIPGVVNLRRSYYPVNMSCDGGTSAKIFSNVSPLGYTGSVIGLGVGGVVDASTGYAFEYPEKITIKLGQSQQVGLNSMNSNVDFK